ncbi:YihY/virulence factor BrkB family protein [Sphingomonas sp.]|uniref:YihY/virulence factor BrkB family protein n=1 Tax=Sphingomonas sp. TaxID=28214 RepID=UPI003AFFD521
MSDANTQAAAVPGAHSSSPWRMPGAAWKDVLVRTWTQAAEDNISLAAAGVAFYGFTAMVPLLGATVLIYGILADPSTVLKDMNSLTTVMPKDAAKLIGEQLMGVVKTSSGKKGFGLILAILIALYGARSAAAAVVTGLNIAYEEKERRSFLRVTALTFAITGATVAVAIVATIAITAVGNLNDILPHLPQPVLLVGKLASYVLLVAAGAAGAATLYRYGPDRVKAKWVWITPGSTIAATIWMLLTIVFGIYVANFGSYDATYGSLGAVVVFLTWLYLTSYVLLLGAELNSEMERQTHVDTTEGPDRPPGQRGSAVADYVLKPEERRGVDDAPRSAPLAEDKGDGRGSMALGVLRAGMLPGLVASAGLSGIRRGRSPATGFGLLLAGGLLALLRRKPYQDDEERV